MRGIVPLAALLALSLPCSRALAGQAPVVPDPGDTVVQFELVGVTSPAGSLTGFFTWDFTKHGWVSMEVHYPDGVAASYGNQSSDPSSISTTQFSCAHNSDTTSYDFQLPFVQALTPTTGSAVALDPPGTPPPNLNAFLVVDNGTTAPIYPITGGSLLPVALTWTDLGLAKAGSAGTPHLFGTGLLTTGAYCQLYLSAAKANASATLVIGLSAIDAPFKGGTLVPAPLTFVVVATNFLGGAQLPFNWPAGVPSGTLLYFQFWVHDAAASKGFSASNGLKATTP
jgi:hypothetical protein